MTKPHDDIPAEKNEEAIKMLTAMEKSKTPYGIEFGGLTKRLNSEHEVIGDILKHWQIAYLNKSTVPDRTNQQTNYEDYCESILIPVDMLRQTGHKDLAHQILKRVVIITDAHCNTPPGKDLHRGAMYAHYGITHLEQDRFEIGLAWLLAAAEEDVRFGRVPDIHGSNAWSENGIYGQWVQTSVLSKLDARIVTFVTSRVTTPFGLSEMMEILKKLSGNGDLSLLRGIVEYDSVKGRHDYMGHSVRFTCIRELASLFEVLLKRIGLNHNDAAVRTAFGQNRMLADMIHFMHYPDTRRQSCFQKLRKVFRRSNPTEAGPLRNSIRAKDAVLRGIDLKFKYVKKFKNRSVLDVWNHLQTTSLLPPSELADEEIAKRFLLAYRLRNETSHSFHPTDPGFVAHADDFRLWLLQSIFFTYFWFTRTGQVTL